MTATPENPDDPRDDNDIDAEFSKLMEGSGLDASLFDEPSDPDDPSATIEQPPGGYTTRASQRRPEAPYEPGTVGSLTGPTPGRTSPEIPDDPSSLHDSSPAHDPNEPTPIALIATPLASAQALAGVIRLAMAAEDDRVSLPESVVTLDAESGAIAAGHVSENEAHTIAHLASLGLQRQGIVMFFRRGDHMSATRYRNGQNEGDTPASLVLGALSSEVEDLLLGLIDLHDIETSYKPAELSRTEALTWIAKGRKKRT